MNETVSEWTLLDIIERLLAFACITGYFECTCDDLSKGREIYPWSDTFDPSEHEESCETHSYQRYMNILLRNGIEV